MKPAHNAQRNRVVILNPKGGCGKSTLLNIIGMLDNPSEGDYFFFDENVAPYSEAKRSEIRKMNIGFIFQSFNLIDELTVAEYTVAWHVASDVDIPQRW
mgnify:CR=1 FL=1